MIGVRYLILFFLLPFAVYSQQFPDQPVPPRLVNDFTKTLSSQEIKLLEDKLVAYNDSTSTQVSIVMISSLDGYPVDDYAIQLAERWGIGQVGKDNGVLIFVAKDDRKIFIPTGYGMEGVMPDGLVKRIIEKDMKPFFRENRFYDGFDKATDSIFRLAAGEYTAEAQTKDAIPVILIILGVIFFVILIIVIQFRSVKTYANVNGLSFWTAWELLNQARRAHHGSWGGFSGGGGSWGGGGSSGGFGGFGGGSFGGGGAGGSW